MTKKPTRADKQNKKIKREIAQSFLSKELNRDLLKEILIRLVIAGLKTSPNLGGAKLIVNSSESGKVTQQIEKAEAKLTSALIGEKEDDDNDDNKDIEHQELDDFDDVDLATIKKLEEKGVRVIYPNLKYRKPKYQNVSEVLKYVESDKGAPDGVKLVIMNFND